MDVIFTNFQTKAVEFHFMIVGDGPGGDIENLSEEDEFVGYVSSDRCSNSMWSRQFCIPPCSCTNWEFKLIFSMKRKNGNW